MLGGVGQPGTRESQVTQIVSTGTSAQLYVNERNMGSTPGHRMIAQSNDGGATYDKASFKTDMSLVSPVTAHWTGIVAGVARLSLGSNSTSKSKSKETELTASGGSGTLMYAGVTNPKERAHMAVRTSSDNGQTWGAPKTVWAGK